MTYELDDVDLEILRKVRKAIAYEDEGTPAKDAIDDDEIVMALRLLLDIVDSEEPT